MKENSIELTIQLPDFVVNLLYSYRDDGYIDIDSFVELAMKFHLDSVVSDMEMNLGCNDYEDETLPITVNMSKEMHYRLNWIALRTHNSPSAILTEVLWEALETIGNALDVISDYGLKIMANKGEHTKNG